MTNTECKKCSKGYYFDKSSGVLTCVKCPDTNCVACNDSKTCTECDATFNYFLCIDKC